MSIFITFEGADGSGKTTQIALLQAWLEASGHTVVRTREPGGTILGEQLRDLLLNAGEVNPKTEALLFAAGRSQHASDVIRPALAVGKIVLCDRYIDSSVAYQGYGRGLGAAKVEELSLWATDQLTPDVCIVLDIDAQTSAERRTSRGAADRIEAEGTAFLEQTRQAYLELARQHPETHVVIDAARTAEEVFKDIQTVVARKLKSITS